MAYSDVLEKNSVAGTALLISGSVLTVTGVKAINTVAAISYLQMFDAAAAADVTVGTTIPRWTVESPASGNSGATGIPDGGIIFRLGLVVASTTTPLNSTGASQHVRIAVQ